MSGHEQTGLRAGGEPKKGGGGIEKNDNTFVQPAHKVIFLLLQL